MKNLMDSKYEPINLETATLEEITAWYNKHSGSTKVQNFTDIETARTKATALKAAMDDMSGRAAGEINKKGKKVAKKNGSKKTSGAKKTAKGKGKGKGKSTKAATAGKKKAANARKFAIKDKHIYKLVDKNPRREGTEGFKSWNVIRNGMTYDQYLDAGGRNRDLRHDILKKRIELRDK
jgi:hypothetical protein